MRRLGVRKVATPSRIFKLWDALDRTLLQIETDHKNNPYLKDLGRRVLNGMLDSARAGFWTGQKPPFGYRVVRTPGEHQGRRRRSGRLVIDPETAPIVHELFVRYRDGANSRDLTRWFSTRTGRQWSRQGVLKLLQKEIYTGTREFGRRTRGRHARLADGEAIIMGNGEDAAQTDENGAVAPEARDVVRIALYPVIINPELFAQVQQRIATGRQRSQKKANPITPLSGLCRCGACGAPMRSARQGPYPYLCCKRRSEEGKEACPSSGYARGEETLRRVLATLAEQLLAGDAVSRLVALAGEAEDMARARWEADVAAAGRALDLCEVRLTTARQRLAEVPDDLLEQMQLLVREMKQKRDGALAEVQRLQAEPPVALEGDADLLSRWLASCRSLCDGVPSQAPEQNAILRELIEEVHVFPPARLIKGKKTVGRVEVVLPEWLSRVLSTTVGSGSQHAKGIVLVSEM
jgi:hypothetical protein